MSALAHHYPVLLGRPRLTLVPTPPVRAIAVSPAVYRRRRLAAVVIALLLVVSGGTAVHSATQWGWQQLHATSVESPSIVLAVASSGSSEPGDATAANVGPAGTPSWTVRPGDTLWSIARSVQPTGDIRPLLGKLHDAYADQPLVVGKTLTIPR